MTELIREYVTSPQHRVQINPELGVILNVKILGTQSKNNRLYPIETLKRAVPLYENARVNLNHPEGDPRRPRNYQDRLGAIRNVRTVINEGLFADFYFNPKHPLAEQLLWDAEHAPENVGFSHNVEAVLEKEHDQMIVREIVSVRSVDLVADPATTSGLFETDHSLLSGPQDLTPPSAQDEISEEVFDENNTETKNTHPTESASSSVCPKTLTQESAGQRIKSIQELKQQLQECRKSVSNSKQQLRTLRTFCEILGQKKELAATECSVMLSKPFLEQIYDCQNEKSVRDLIEDRIQLIKRIAALHTIPAHAPLSMSRFPMPGPFHEIGDSKSFVQSITQ